MFNKHIHNITISHKHTLVNIHSFRQGSRIVLYAWSHYLMFEYCIQQHLRTYRFVVVAQATKLYMLLSTISQLLITMWSVHPMVTLTFCMNIKVSIISRNQLMVSKPYHSMKIIIIKSSFNMIFIMSEQI